MGIKLEKISKSYKEPVLINLDLEIEDGEFIAIMGPSGTGKSTLLKILGLQIRETSGRYIIGDKDVSLLKDEKRSKMIASEIGYVDQNIYLFDSLTIKENIFLATHGADKKVDTDYLKLLINYFKLENLLDKHPFELSGGERQRIVIVRNLLKKPQLLLMDEPTSSLDFNSSKELLDLISKYQQKLAVSTVIVTHNSNVAKYAKRVILLKNGKVFTNIYRGDSDFETKINNAQAAMYRSDYDRN